MADNFNIHDWNRNRLIESTLGDAELKAKQRVDTIYNQVIKDFPEKFESPIEKSSLKYSISSALTDLSMLSEEKDLKKYTVQFWQRFNDDLDDRDVDIMASSEEEAIAKAKEDNYKGKNFKVIQIDGEFVKETLSPLKETIKFIMENPEGYSKYFPGGKTKGLTKDTLSTILKQIMLDTEEEGEQLNESTLCKRGQDYIKSRKAAGEKSSAYLSGRAVKVCKGDIKFKGKKQKDFKG